MPTLRPVAPEEDPFGPPTGGIAPGSAEDPFGGGTGAEPSPGEYIQPYEEKLAAHPGVPTKTAVPVGKPKLVKGVTDDEVILAFGYDPAVVKKSPGWSDGMLASLFDKKYAPTVSPRTERLAQLPSGMALEAVDAVEGIVQAGERAGNVIGKLVGSDKTPLLQLHQVHRLARLNNRLNNVEGGRRVDEQGRKEIALEDVGGVAAPSPVPKIAMLGRFNTLVKGAAGGATSTQDEVSPDAERENFGDTAGVRAMIGTAIGPAVAGAGRVASGALGKLLNRNSVAPPTSEQEVLARRLDKEGIPYNLGDVNPDATNVRGIESIVTPASAKIAQRNAADDAVQARVRTLGRELQSEVNKFKAPAGFNAALRDPKNGNHKEAVSLLQKLKNPSEDWADHVELDARFAILKAKLKSDHGYDKVRSSSQGVTNVSNDNFRTAVEDLATRRGAGTPTGLDNKYLDQLRDLVKGAQAPRMAPTTFAAMIDQRQKIAEIAAKQGKPGNVAEDIELLREAMLKDMEVAANKVRKPYLIAQLKTADKTYQDTARVQETLIAQSLEKGKYVDEIVPMFKRSHENGGYDRARDLYESLGSRGRKAIEYGLLKDALENSFEKKRFLPTVFYDNMKRQEKLYGVFLTKTDPHEVQGLVNVMQYLDRTGTSAAEVNVQRLARSGMGGAAVTGLSGGMQWSGSRAVLGQILGGMGINTALNHPAMRKYWLAASDLKPGHPDMKRIATLITSAINRESASVAGQQFSPSTRPPKKEQ